MPEGLVNILSGRQEFLDLARYLMEIAEKGPERVAPLAAGGSPVCAAAAAGLRERHRPCRD